MQVHIFLQTTFHVRLLIFCKHIFDGRFNNDEVGRGEGERDMGGPGMVLEEDQSFEGVRKCAQCHGALCSGGEDEDEEVYCFACKGGNSECPLSY